MSITYEWVIETVNVESDDIESLDHRDSYADTLVVIERNPPPAGYRYDICLVRDQFHVDDPNELIDRQWAYVIDGALEAEFDGGANVPAKFRNEVAA